MRYLKQLVWMNALLWAQSPSWGRAYVDSAASVVPQYIVSPVVNANTRVPYVAYLVIRGLEPNTPYRYVVRMDDNTTPATSLNINAGAGNPIYYDAGSGTFTRTQTASLNIAGNYGLVTTDAIGQAEIVFILEATGNARFDVSKLVYPKVFLLHNAANPTDSAVVYADKTPVKPIAFRSSCPNQDTCGSFLYDSITPSLVSSKFVFLYDEYLLGPNPSFKRPIAGAIVEPTNISYPTSYLTTYRNEVADKPGRWGTIIPNTLPNGIRSIVYHERGHTVMSVPLADVGIYDRDGQWPSGYNTANPNNGPTRVGLLMSLTQPLRLVLGIRQPDAYERGFFIWRNLGTNPLCTQCDGFVYVTNDLLLSSSPPPLLPSYSEDCAYTIGSGNLPLPPVDSTLLPTAWGLVGGPGWGGAFGDSLRIPALLARDLSGDFLWPTITLPPQSDCSVQLASCQEIFSPSGDWKWKLHPVAFSNEAGNLVLNYNYEDQMGFPMAPFYQATVSGPFSVPGMPVGLIETSGADLTSLNVNTTPTLSIRAVLPYEVQAYPAFPFEFGSPNTGYLQWELVRASDNTILSSGNTLFPFGTNSCGLPNNSPNECSYETSVSVSGLATGDYQIRGWITPPVCPGNVDPVTPIPTSPLNFTVTVGTGLASSTPAKPIIRTTSMAWQIEGVSGPIALYDAQGRRVWSGTAEQNTILISRQNLSPGLYLLVAETPAGPSVHRLLHLTE
jgi:hypothetical protein